MRSHLATPSAPGGIVRQKKPCATDIAGFLRFQPRAVSKPLKSHDPICRSQKNRIRIGGSLTHLTHITHRIFGFSYASCSWSPMRWPAPDHDHESARAAYLRGPLPGACLACCFRNCGWSLRSRRSAAPDRPVQGRLWRRAPARVSYAHSARLPRGLLIKRIQALTKICYIA
jgi:hypothetical protein